MTTAQETGKLLGEKCITLFKSKLINIVGYSLGVEVIASFLKVMIDKNKAHLLNKIVLLGGVTNVKVFEDLQR